MITTTETFRAKQLIAGMINAYNYSRFGKKNSSSMVKPNDIIEDKIDLEDLTECAEFKHDNWRCYVTNNLEAFDSMVDYLVKKDKMTVEYHGVVEGLAYMMTLMKK